MMIYVLLDATACVPNLDLLYYNTYHVSYLGSTQL